MVDVALLYAELERTSGAARADIARQYGKSPGYVSIMCRLGYALRTLSPEAREALRVRQITFKAAQAAVSRFPRVPDLLAALDGLAAVPPARRRRRAAGGAAPWRAPVAPHPDEDPLDPLPLLAGERAARQAAGQADLVFRWDAAAAQRDPAAVLDAFEAFVRAATDDVVDRLRRAATHRTPSKIGGADGTRTDGAPRLPSVLPPGFSLELSLRALDERVKATLRTHRQRMAEFEAERAAPRRAPGGPLSQPGVARAPESPSSPRRGAPAVPVTDEEIAADLAE